MEERIAELLEQQNQLLTEISTSLPSADTYQQIDNLNQVATYVREYLNGKQEAEQNQGDIDKVTRETAEDRYNQIYDLLSSIDGKVTPDEAETTADTADVETNQEILQVLTDMTTQNADTAGYVQSIQNVSVPMLCGVGMIAGILLCSILSRFFKN